MISDVKNQLNKTFDEIDRNSKIANLDIRFVINSLLLATNKTKIMIPYDGAESYIEAVECFEINTVPLLSKTDYSKKKSELQRNMNFKFQHAYRLLESPKKYDKSIGEETIYKLNLEYTKKNHALLIMCLTETGFLYPQDTYGGEVDLENE